jgi:uncharacterized protein (DUF2236 family)
MAYEAIVAPLEPFERDTYCREAAGVAIELGAEPADVPVTWAGLLGYIDRVGRSRVLSVGADAKAVADALLSGGLSAVAGPAGWANRRLTAGWLPADLREQYGLAWGARHEREFRWLLRTLRRARRFLPRPVAWWPEARTL